MADKNLAALTAASDLAAGDLFYISQSGNSRKITTANLKMGEILLATNTPTGTSTSFDVATLTSGYSFNHLRVRFFGRCDAAVSHRELRITVNSDTGSNYDGSYAQADGNGNTDNFADDGATSFWGGYIPGTSAQTGNAGESEIFIPEYASTTFRKKFRVLAGSVSVADASAAAGSIFAFMASAQWRNTAAITAIGLAVGIGGSFITGTTVRLYGVY